MLCENVHLRTHLYYRIAEDDPPNHFARPPCTLKTWWSLAPPNHAPPPPPVGVMPKQFFYPLCAGN